MKISTIIFDMDGVVVDSEPVHQKNEQEMFRELGLSISEEEHNSYIGCTAKETWNRIKDKHGLNKSIDELFVLGRNRYLNQLGSNAIQLVKGSRELIEMFNAKGFNVLLASSASCRTIEAVLAHFYLREKFQVLIGADDIVNSKPAPDPFLKAAERMNVDPQECLVIEDAANGVTAAKTAGMVCIGYQNPSAFHQDLSHADLIVSELSQITPAVISSLGH